MHRVLAMLLFGLAVGGPVGWAEETWTKVSTHHFTILTPAGEQVGRKWAIELEQFRRGLQATVPVPVQRLRPVTVVLFKHEREMAPFSPLEKGQPIKIGGFFVRANDVNTIMLSLARNDMETRRVIFHEAVHWHLSARENVMPLWLAEGLAEVYSTFAMPDAKTYVFGDSFDEHVTRLREESLLPLAKLVGIGRDSLLYNEGTRTGIFYAEAWAFVHFLLHGEKSPGPSAVQRYLELLPRLRSPDDAFIMAFGADYATLERQLRRYITSGSYHKHVHARSTDDIARVLRVTRAQPADVALAKGALLLVGRSPEEAEPFLGQAAELAPSDPRPWELLGNVAMSRRDFPTALAVLTKAVEAGSNSYLVYHNRAIARMPELAEPWIPGQTIDPLVLDRVAADFRKAIALSPAHVPSYEGLAGLMGGVATLMPEDPPLLARGLLQSPGNVMIEAGIAATEMRGGRVADGRARLERLCARHPTATNIGVSFARRLLENEILQSEIDAIGRLMAQSKLPEVIEIADGALTRSLEPAGREFMQNARQRAIDYQKLRAAVDLANEGKSAEARETIEAVLATMPERAVEKEARRILHDIAEREPRVL